MCTKVVGIIGSPMAGVMICAVVFPAMDLLVSCATFCSQRQGTDFHYNDTNDKTKKVKPSKIALKSTEGENAEHFVTSYTQMTNFSFYLNFKSI